MLAIDNYNIESHKQILAINTDGHFDPVFKILFEIFLRDFVGVDSSQESDLTSIQNSVIIT